MQVKSDNNNSCQGCKTGYWKSAVKKFEKVLVPSNKLILNFNKHLIGNT